MSEALPTALRGLLQPSAYPHAVDEVKFVETHLAWIFLAGQFAYKIKRPVRYPFVDQRSPDKRAFLCREEIRLNRRFAPALYLGVSRIVEVDGVARIDVDGPTLEFAVRMRRFDSAQQLDRLLEAGNVEAQELEIFGERLAEIHSGLPFSSESLPWGWPSAIRRIQSENVAECSAALKARFGSEYPLETLEAALMNGIEALGALMTLRIDDRAVRECHGDLHCRNIVRHDGALTPYDCMEFEPAFRWIDVAEDVAFLTMDLASRGHDEHSHRFLSGWLTRGGDYTACRLIHLYEAHHALVRAKVVALSPDDAGDPHAVRARIDACIDIASKALGRHSPVLIVVCGFSGSGKTTLAKQLVQDLHAVHIRSDIERKRLAGILPTSIARSRPGTGLYTAESSERVHVRLQACAQACLAGGYTAVVDATFNTSAEREGFRDLASRAAIKLVFLHCHAPLEVLRDRITRRAALGNDPSDADLNVLDWQVARAEPIGMDEGVEWLSVDTSGPALSPALSQIVGFCSALAPPRPLTRSLSSVAP